MRTDIPDNWYENFFSGINCEMWRKAATPEWTNAEAEFLKDVLNASNGSHLLDMPCGVGRHAIALAKHGINVTAVDISEEFLNDLREAIVKENLSIDVIQGNILTLHLNGFFDGAYCLGNSFGYFDHEGMKTFVQKVSSCLKHQAKWVINTGLLAESFLAKFAKEHRYELGDLVMEISNDYDEWASCLLTTLTYTKNSKQEVHRFKHYVYTLAEVIRLLQLFNLKTVAVYSSTTKTDFKLGDGQAYIVAEKI